MVDKWCRFMCCSTAGYGGYKIASMVYSDSCIAMGFSWKTERMNYTNGNNYYNINFNILAAILLRFICLIFLQFTVNIVKSVVEWSSLLKFLQRCIDRTSMHKVP